jgi:hypothetical protein
MDKPMLIRLIVSVVVVLCCGIYFYKRQKAEIAARNAIFEKYEALKKYEAFDEELIQKGFHNDLDKATINYLITKAKAEDKTPAEIIGEMVREKLSAAA